MLPISPYEADKNRIDEADLIKNLFRGFGVGGASWIITRSDMGTGIHAPVQTTIGVSDVYFALQRDVNLPLNVADTPIPSESWVFASFTSSDIRPLDTIHSVSDTSLAFVVQTVSNNDFLTTIGLATKQDKIGRRS